MPRRRAADFQGVTDAELNVLKLLWRLEEETPSGLRDRLSESGTDWAYTTVQTLLHRLLAKGYVERRRAGVAQHYRARVTQEDLLAEHMDELAERVCDGSASPLLLSLVRARKLSKKDIAHMREILDEAAAGGTRRRSPRTKKGPG